ncbi:MAG: tetratricopeptide repeat protein, partial [SAR202 cluster bacterium]|nr:tetratricopeptide repeat protein [SAR202 cluster bacterium]
MKYIIVIITFFLSYAVIAESGFVIIQNQIKDHIQKHEYEEAKELKNQYLNSANKSLPYQSKEFAIVLSDLSLLYEGLGDYDQAIKYQEEILEIYTDIKDYYGMAISLNNLSSMNNDLGKFSISIDYAVQSIDLLIKHYGDDTQYLVEPLISRGVALQKKGNYLESIEFFQKATSIELANRKRDSVIANISNNIGVSFSYAGNYAEAVQYYTKAIEIRERIFGSNDPSVAGVLNSLGQIYVLLNELDLAERTLLRGLYIREKNFGDDHLLTIRSKMNLSIFYNYSGQGEKGAETLEGVIDPLINQFGFYHPETYKTFIALSSYYSGEGDNFEKSEEYGLKALEIGEKILDPL